MQVGGYVVRRLTGIGHVALWFLVVSCFVVGCSHPIPLGIGYFFHSFVDVIVRFHEGSISSTLLLHWMFGQGEFGSGMGCGTCELRR